MCITSFIFTICCLSMKAQSKDSLLVYTVKMDSLHIAVSDYDYVLVFDAYLCKDCISPKVQKKKKILLLPLHNDATYESRLHTKLSLKQTYPVSDCYFLGNQEEKLAIVQRYQKNKLISTR